MHIPISIQIKLLRLLNNIDQPELCKATGINRQYLSIIENGHRPPTPTEQATLEAFFGITFEDAGTHFAALRRVVPAGDPI